MKDQDGNVVFSKTHEYKVGDYYVKEADPALKDGPIMVANWWFDRQVHIHEGIEPGETDSRTIVVPLKKGIKSVIVEASYRFIYEEGNEAVWQKVSKKVEF